MKGLNLFSKPNATQLKATLKQLALELDIVVIVPFICMKFVSTMPFPKVLPRLKSRLIWLPL